MYKRLAPFSWNPCVCAYVLTRESRKTTLLLLSSQVRPPLVCEAQTYCCVLVYRVYCCEVARLLVVAMHATTTVIRAGASIVEPLSLL
jgi:hypothetical protein